MTASDRPFADGNAARYELGDLLVPSAKRSSSEPDNQNARAAPGGVRTLTLADGDESPELALDLDHARPDPRASQPQAAPESGHQSMPGGMLGDGFEDDDMLAALPELEVEAVDRRAEARVGLADEGADPKVLRALDAARTRELAGYGAPPSGFIACVPYAVRVGVRQVALRRQRRGAQESVARASQVADVALRDLGEGLLGMSDRPQLEPLAASVAAVRQTQASSKEVDASLAELAEREQRQLSELDEEAAALRTQLAPYRQRESELAEVHRQADERVKRGQALVKRVDIELRALSEAKAPLDPGRLLELQTQRGEREQAVSAILPALEAAQAELAQARRELALREEALRVVDEKKRSAMNEMRAVRQEAAQAAQAVQDAYEAALRDLARAARAQELDTLLGEQAERAEAAETELSGCHKELARFDEALTLFDRSGVVRGVSLVLLAFAAALAASLLR